MDLKISDLKVGAKLIFGNYGVTTASNPITWLKASRDNEFLSEFVLDLLRFDAQERNNPNRDMYWHGNGTYELSNIIQFMNSYEEDWYEPMHDHDAPPGSVSNNHDGTGDYVNHAGFLHDFEDYELESLAGRIELPTIANIFGRGGVPKFPLFNRKGFRGKPTADLVYGRYGHDLSETSYCEYWLKDGAGAYTVNCVDRAGVCRGAYASHYRGFRPKCKMKPETKVEQLPDGSFRIIPFGAIKPRSTNVCTDEEFMALMGLL